MTNNKIEYQLILTFESKDDQPLTVEQLVKFREIIGLRIQGPTKEHCDFVKKEMRLDFPDEIINKYSKPKS